MVKLHKQKEIDEYANNVKPNIETYIHKHFKDIHHITFTKSEQSPTGSVMISGYVNNDKKLNFDVVVDYPETDIQGGFGYSNELSKYEVFPNENK